MAQLYIITAFFTIEFGLQGEPSNFYEEGGTKKARRFAKDGSKGGRRGETKDVF
jgi:hypothetical protein